MVEMVGSEVQRVDGLVRTVSRMFCMEEQKLSDLVGKAGVEIKSVFDKQDSGALVNYMICL